MRLTLLVAALAGLITGAAQGAEDTPPIVGFWYSRGQPQDAREENIDVFYPDGRFVSLFRKYENCEVQWETAQTGKWRLEGTALITIVENTARNENDRTQRYTVELVVQRELHLRHLGTGYVFKARRQDNPRFPICEAGA